MSSRTVNATVSKLRAILLADGRELSLAKPLVMGVLNVTPDSFSDGGQFESPKKAIDRALEIEQQGADMIDVGGESSRPGADPVSLDVELGRVVPVIEAIRHETKISISVDTYKAEVAKAAIEAGADVINDISALRFDPKMADLASEREVPVILMHMLGTPKDMQQNPKYVDCVSEIILFFRERLEFCEARGIERNRLIIDPGIGFGKRLEDNLSILAQIDHLKQMDLPLLIGASRKSFIEMLCPGDNKATDRLGGSIAAAAVAILGGADIIRVHDVRETVEAMGLIEAVKESR